MNRTADVIPFKPRSYVASLQEVYASGLTITASGTLDGFVDFVAEASDGKRIIYQITRDDAVAIADALRSVIVDISENCLFDRDPLLEPR